MSIINDRQDFEDYIKKSKQEPDPKLNSIIWNDDPYMRNESYPRSENLKKRKIILKRKQGKK